MLSFYLPFKFFYIKLGFRFFSLVQVIFHSHAHPLVRRCVCVCVCVSVCVVSVTVKRPVLTPCVVDGRSTNPLYYYYYYYPSSRLY